MRTLLAIAIGMILARGALAADCSAYAPTYKNPSADHHLLSSSGFYYPDPCFGDWDTDYVAFMQGVDSNYCAARNQGDPIDCGLTAFRVPIVWASGALASGADDLAFFAADRALKLVTMGCRCLKNCGTPATLAFKTRTGSAIALTGGGDLTASTGTASITRTTFDTADSDRILADGDYVLADITNSQTADQELICTGWAVTVP